MAISIPNPYTGQDEETCSVSFAAQQQMAGGVGSSQTEAQYNKSKLLGEWGVIQGKLFKGEIPKGTKILTYSSDTGKRGYVYVSGKHTMSAKVFTPNGNKVEVDQFLASNGTAWINSDNLSVSIPQAVAAKPKPEPVKVVFNQPGYVNKADFTHGQIVAVNANGQGYIKLAEDGSKFEVWGFDEQGSWSVIKSSGFLGFVMDDEDTWYKPDGKDSTPNAKPATVTPPTPSSQVAAPVAATPVDAGSTSVGSMSHEDVAAMFVKIKDDLAKEQGLNIKGANPELDKVVYDKIGEATGYTGAEVKGKIDAYKAQGNKLSALKKKVLAGTKKVPIGKAQPAKQSAPHSPLAAPSTKATAPDPQPHAVPTVATPKVADTIKAEVKKEVKAEPAKVYSPEDVASAYIIAKDAIVANNTKGWTLYTKNDEFDLEIAIQVGLKTGLNPLQQKQAIAEYLGSGKKLSTLKKQLAKQGAFTPQADSLKKSGADKDAAAKKADVDAKAEAGYTPTPTPATADKAGDPKVDTGKPAPKKVVGEAQERGDISNISAATQKEVFQQFKLYGQESYLSSGPAHNYDGFAKLQLWAKGNGEEFTLLQLIRIVDEQGAIKVGKPNAHLFEKQVATWLTTPDGTAHIKANEAKLAKLVEQEKNKAEAAKLAKKLQDNQPPLPADSAQYQDWSLEKATRISKTWLQKEPHTAKQKAGLKHYTGSAYHAMNGYLRGLRTTIDESDKRHIEPAKQGMRPTTEPILVKRGTGANQFQTLGIERGDTAPGQVSSLWGITGKSFKDEGFLSTSAGGRAAFSGEVKMEIECPIGTPMMYVDPFSKHPGENEMLLQAGLTYKILQVRKEGSQFIVRARVVDWPGKKG